MTEALVAAMVQQQTTLHRAMLSMVHLTRRVDELHDQILKLTAIVAQIPVPPPRSQSADDLMELGLLLGSGSEEDIDDRVVPL